MSEPTTNEIDITRLGAQGDGVAETPEGPIYVPYTLPGERVRVLASTGERRRLVQVLTASPDRVTPMCRHFQACGGCMSQHMARGVYRDWKRGIVVQAFAHRGLAPEIGPMIEVAPGTRRRAVMTALQTGAARTESTIVLGFHAEGSDRVVGLAECPVMAPALVAALPLLRRLAAVLLANGRDAQVTVTATVDGLDVAFDGDGLATGAGERAALARGVVGSGIVRLTCGSDLIVQRMVPTSRFGDATVGLPSGAFIQATAEAELEIAATIARAVGKSKRVADLFAGVGTFSFALARRARVLAIDSDRAAIEALAAASRHVQGLKPIETRVRDLLREPLSRKELEGLDAVVFDPPRAGAKRQAEMLARSQVPIVVAVSCNPATLARDARILVDGGYRLGEVVPIDQFVWSTHVEAVAVFRRGQAGLV